MNAGGTRQIPGGELGQGRNNYYYVEANDAFRNEVEEKCTRVEIGETEECEVKVRSKFDSEARRRKIEMRGKDSHYGLQNQI